MAQWFEIEEFEADVISRVSRALFIVWEYEEKARSIIDSSVGNNEFTKMMKVTDSIRNLDTTIPTLREKSTKNINLLLDYVVYWEIQNHTIENVDDSLVKFLTKVNNTINRLQGFFNFFYPLDYKIFFDVRNEKHEYQNKKFTSEFTLNVYTTNEF